MPTPPQFLQISSLCVTEFFSGSISSRNSRAFSHTSRFIMETAINKYHRYNSIDQDKYQLPDSRYFLRSFCSFCQTHNDRPSRMRLRLRRGFSVVSYQLPQVFLRTILRQLKAVPTAGIFSQWENLPVLVCRISRSIHEWAEVNISLKGPCTLLSGPYNICPIMPL